MSPLAGYVTMSPEESLRTLVRFALAEDIGSGDWTTLWTVDEEARGRAEVVAKEDLVVAGVEAAVEVFTAVEPALEIGVVQGDGVRAASGSVVLTVDGPVQPILVGERTALNFLGALSGIATLTRRYVEEVRGTEARIMDTRKTTPGWRRLEKEAVRAGGGFNHRMGLYDMVMVKDNHVVAAGGLMNAVERVSAHNRSGLPVEVEVTTLEELDEALSARVQRVMLDNMELEAVREAVRRAHELGEERPEVEVSGNVTLDRVRGLAETGVDLVSVGALTHSASAADFSLRLLPREG